MNPFALIDSYGTSLNDTATFVADVGGMDAKDVAQTISNLHKMISQNETSLMLMRAELARLKELVEPEEPPAAVPAKADDE